MTIKIDVVTAEGTVLSDDVDVVIAPGAEGQLGILPHHAPLMTTLQPGQLLTRKGGEESCIAVTGGFLEVRPDHVVVLADAAERAEDIDVCRAEEAMKHAQQRLKEKVPGVDTAHAEAALRRAMARLQAAERARLRQTKTTRK